VKRLLMSITLAVVLSSPALAGDIPSGGIAPPHRSGQTEKTIPTPSGLIPSDGKAQQISSGVLSALLSALGLLV
jgi:hypothetical protein